MLQQIIQFLNIWGQRIVFPTLRIVLETPVQVPKSGVLVFVLVPDVKIVPDTKSSCHKSY